MNAWLRLQRKRLGALWQWIADHLHQRNHQILVSIAIGLVSGLVAVLLKWATHKVRAWVHGDTPDIQNLAFIFLPAAGIALSVFYLRRILRQPVQTGLGSLVRAVSSKSREQIPRYEMYAHVVTTSLTVGFGGSVGMEAPIVRTGAAIGANLARILRANRKERDLFLACGVAAGIAAIFNSPVAGVLFAFEVLLPATAIHSFVPLLIAAATGTVVGRSLYYEQLFFLPTTNWDIGDIPFFALLGGLCGLMSVYLIRVNSRVREFFQGIPNLYVKIGGGGLLLGLMIFIFPPLFGEGYETVNHLLQGQYEQVMEHSFFYRFSSNTWALLGFVALVMLLKIVATAVTIGSGGNGGIFAPSMLVGATLGFLFSHSLNQLGWITLSENNFIGVGMAGILSGVFKAPLTGIFLIAEVTGGYKLFVPLMLVAAMSYFISFYFEPFSIFTRELYRKGLWVPAHEKDRLILKHLRLEDMVERDFARVEPQQTLGALVGEIARSRRNLFPVIGADGRLEGIILLDDVRELMFVKELYETTFVRDLLHAPPAILELQDPMEKVMRIFEKTGAWNLPVVQEGKYLGFVSKSAVFNRYREALQEFSA